MNKSSKKHLHEKLLNRETSEYRVKVFSKTCATKKLYTNKNKAKYVAGMRSKDTKEQLEPYKCNYGKHWHIGHPMTLRRLRNA